MTETIPKTRLRKNDGYEKPELTFTEKLTNDDIEEMLDDYVEVENLAQVPLGTHIRYIATINGKKKFRIGGILSNTKGLPKYIVLVNSAGKSWSVQTKNTVFYRQMTRKEIREEYEEVIDELEEQIEKHLKTIDNLKALVQKYKDDVMVLKSRKN